MSLVVTFVDILARVLSYAIFIRILLSWVPTSRESRLVMFIYEITEPILGPLRRVVPSLGGFDISPMLGLLLIELARRVLFALLARLG